MACGGCRSSKSGTAASSPEAGSADAATPLDPRKAAAAARDALRVEDGSERERLAWEHAKSGEDEDLATLALAVGVAGLESGLGDRARKETALRSMAFAPGFSQVKPLAEAARSAPEELARIALESLVDLGARPRVPVEHEEEAELAEGCRVLAGIAQQPDVPRPRRVLAIRAARQLPCPQRELEAGLPTDLDSK